MVRRDAAEVMAAQRLNYILAERFRVVVDGRPRSKSEYGHEYRTLALTHRDGTLAMRQHEGEMPHVVGEIDPERNDTPDVLVKMALAEIGGSLDLALVWRERPYFDHHKGVTTLYMRYHTMLASEMSSG